MPGYADPKFTGFLSRAVAEDTLIRMQNCIAQLKQGDASARDQLFEYADRRLRILTDKMLSSFDRVRAFEGADDVRQNASIRLLRALNEIPITTPTDFFRLAATQIRRELIDLSRHYYGPAGLGQRQSPLPSTDNSALAASTWNSTRLASWSEFHSQVERLPDDEKAVFDLLWYQDLEQSEAAEALGISVATVKRRWMAARLRLKENVPGQLPAV